MFFQMISGILFHWKDGIIDLSSILKFLFKITEHLNHFNLINNQRSLIINVCVDVCRTHCKHL